MKNSEKNRGITLVALVVTVVVLLILAVISVNALFGESGLITMAQKAKQEYQDATKKEQQQLTGTFGKNYVDYNGALHIDGAKILNQYNEDLQLNGLYYRIWEFRVYSRTFKYI